MSELQHLDNIAIIDYQALMSLDPALYDESTVIAMEKRLLDDVAAFDIKQKATKISLNSLYGVIGNGYFRFFDLDNAEAVTLTGQFIIQYIAGELNRIFNQWLQTKDVRYALYCDTDSVYLSCEEYVKQWTRSIVTETGKQPTHGETIAELDKFCSEKVEKFITNAFRKMNATCLNGVGDFLRMKREVIADKGIWTAKKRYILSVFDDEGVKYTDPKLKYVGVEIAKASAPKFCRDAMLKAVKLLMKGDKASLWALTEETRQAFNELPVEDIAFPRSVNNLAKYSDPEGKMAYLRGTDEHGQRTIGTPFHVKGALIYNFLLDQVGLAGKFQKIKDGEKIKFVALKEPNPTGGSVISFLNILPQEMNLHRFVDYDVQFQKSFVDPLNLILHPVGWTHEPVASLESFFV